MSAEAEPFTPATEAIYRRMVRQSEKLYVQIQAGDATACDAMVLLFSAFFAQMLSEDQWPHLMSVVEDTMRQAAQLDRTLNETAGNA